MRAFDFTEVHKEMGFDLGFKLGGGWALKQPDIVREDFSVEEKGKIGEVVMACGSDIKKVASVVRPIVVGMIEKERAKRIYQEDGREVEVVELDGCGPKSCSAQ